MFRLPKFCFSLIFNEGGVAPILVLFLLVVGILGGTYLVQQRTNILPFAQEQTSSCTETQRQICARQDPTEGCMRDSSGESTCIPIDDAGCAKEYGNKDYYFDLDSNGCQKASSEPTCQRLYGVGYTYTAGRCVQKLDQGDCISQHSGDNTWYYNNSLERCAQATTVQECQDLYGSDYTLTTGRCVKKLDTGDCISNHPGDNRWYYDNNTGKCIQATTSKECSNLYGSDYVLNNNQCVQITCAQNCSEKFGMRGGCDENNRCLWAQDQIGQACSSSKTQECIDQFQLNGCVNINSDKYTVACSYSSSQTSCVDSDQKTCASRTDGKTLCKPLAGNTKDYFQCYAPNNPSAVVTPESTTPRAETVQAQGRTSASSQSTAPSDPAVCRDQNQTKTCIYSQGDNQCFLGLCKSGSCGFNSSDCSYQNGASKSCLNTTYTHTNGNYSVSGKVGAKVNCPSTPDQGGTAGSTTTAANSSSTSTTTTSSSSTSSLDTQTGKVTGDEVKELAAKCGFKADDNLNIPIFKIGIGENISVNDADCKKLLNYQLDSFNELNTQALEKLKDVAKANNLAIQGTGDGGYTVTDNGNLTDDQKKVKENLQSTLNNVNSTNSKLKECQGKTSSTDEAACLKEAQTTLSSAASDAQKATLAHYVQKYEEILNGKADSCVKADLGVAPFLEAKRLKARGGTTPGVADAGDQRDFYRLLLCSGKSSSKDKLDLKWRVLTTGSDNGGDPDNDHAERIYGLHGTDEKATNVEPKYPFDIKNGPTLTGQTKDAVQTALKPWYDAAKAGQLQIAGQANQRGQNSTRDRQGSSSSNASSQTSSSQSSLANTSASNLTKVEFTNFGDARPEVAIPNNKRSSAVCLSDGKIRTDAGNGNYSTSVLADCRASGRTLKCGTNSKGEIGCYK